MTYHNEQKNIKCYDTKIASLQLLALLNAELKEPFSLGIKKPSESEIDAVVLRAVESFLLLYFYTCAKIKSARL